LDVFWTKTVGGIAGDAAAGIAVDNLLNVYTIGNFGNTVDFDPNAGVFNLTAMGANDIFALKINQSSPLPIKLISFTAGAVNNKEIICQWTTSSELTMTILQLSAAETERTFKKPV
jgi:hypothetical protein